MEQGNSIKTGTCKLCGQSVLVSDDIREAYQNITEADELATLACECEGGKKWREAKKQEIINTAFIAFAEHELVGFMKENDYKIVKVQDDSGNAANLFRMENGDIKITTSIKRVI